MRAVRTAHTSPELRLRRVLWAAGLRYRLHSKRIPGRPDIAFGLAKLAVFVDGCFWHGCPRCYTPPGTNASFWRAKLRANRKRRVQVRKALRAIGWIHREVWECEIEQDPTRVAKRLQSVVSARRT